MGDRCGGVSTVTARTIEGRSARRVGPYVRRSLCSARDAGRNKSFRRRRRRSIAAGGRETARAVGRPRRGWPIRNGRGAPIVKETPPWSISRGDQFATARPRSRHCVGAIPTSFPPDTIPSFGSLIQENFRSALTCGTSCAGSTHRTNQWACTEPSSAGAFDSQSEDGRVLIIRLLRRARTSLWSVDWGTSLLTFPRTRSRFCKNPSLCAR